MPVLLDSVILIDHLKGVPAAGSFLASMRGEWISVVTRAEVLVGAVAGNAERVRRFLDNFPLLEIDGAVADHAADLRRAHHWQLPDAFQAAIAQKHGLQLATRNTKDFPPSKYPWVIVPYTIK